MCGKGMQDSWKDLVAEISQNAATAENAEHLKVFNTYNVERL